MKYLHGRQIYVQSVGVRPSEIDPFVVAVLDEIGIDLSRHRARSFEDLEDDYFDLVISLSPEAQHRAVELTRTSSCADRVLADPRPEPDRRQPRGPARRLPRPARRPARAPAPPLPAPRRAGGGVRGDCLRQTLQGNASSNLTQSIFVPGLTLPYHQDLPIERRQLLPRLCVTFDVACQLRSPIGRIATRHPGPATTRMLVPEAAVHKDGQPPPRQHDVGRAGQVLAMESKAQSLRVKRSTDRDLRPSVALADARHNAVACIRVHNATRHLSP